MLILISGVSGSGKNTIIAKLLENNKFNLKFLTSCTTRKIREGEVDGYTYHFLTEEQFDEKLKNNEFAENVQLHSHRVGVLKNSLLNAETENIIKDIDVYGVNNIKEYLKDSSVKFVTVFLDVDKKTLEERLKSRGEKDIELRLKRYDLENSFKNSYDYVIYNDNIQETTNKILNILEKEIKG